MCQPKSNDLITKTVGTTGWNGEPEHVSENIPEVVGENSGKKKRKRVAVKEQWKSKQRKINGQSGKSYISKSNLLVPEKNDT